MSAIYDRRSIRRYKADPVSRSDIEEILRAGIAAPSAKNKQPWKYVVYTGASKSALLDVMERGLIREREQPVMPLSKRGIPDAFNTLRIMRQAPVLIMIMYPDGSCPFGEISGEERMWELLDQISIGASVENILLRAQELGIGSLWVGNTCFAYDELVKAVGMDGQLIGALSLGYADESPSPRPRLSFEQSVVFVEDE